MAHVIIDKTTNTEAIYIDEQGQNCELLENAKIYRNKIEALNAIIDNDWGEWAMVKPVNEC